MEYTSINNLRQFTDLTEQIGSMLMQCKSDMFSSKHTPALGVLIVLNQLNNAFIICEEGVRVIMPGLKTKLFY